MEQNEKESFFVDNFGHYLLNFISDRVKIAGQSNSDKWSLLFHKIESGRGNTLYLQNRLKSLVRLSG